jgi:hypothetical protein
MTKKLHILWTNDNLQTSEHMVLMYAPITLQNEMWDEITVIIWGATSTLVAENKHMQKLIADAQEIGVKFTACKTCAEKLGTEQALTDLGIEIKGWGKPLTELIQNKEHLLTI